MLEFKYTTFSFTIEQDLLCARNMGSHTVYI